MEMDSLGISSTSLEQTIDRELKSVQKQLAFVPYDLESVIYNCKHTDR